MTIEAGVCERLGAMGALTALVASRIYQLKLPQQPTLPAVRVQMVGEIDELHLRGPDRVLRTRVQVDAYAHELAGGDPYATATEVADAVHGDGLGPNATGLNGWIGDVGGSPDLRVLVVKRVGRLAMYEADELRLVRVRQDYRIDWIAMN